MSNASAFVVLVAVGVALGWWHAHNEIKNNTALKVVTVLYLVVFALFLLVGFISFITF